MMQYVSVIGDVEYKNGVEDMNGMEGVGHGWSGRWMISIGGRYRYG